eukprot:1257956-Amorphochlora_amoeboformis.AAC.1
MQTERKQKKGKDGKGKRDVCRETESEKEREGREGKIEKERRKQGRDPRKYGTTPKIGILVLRDITVSVRFTLPLLDYL